MKTRKIIFSMAAALMVSGFVTAQSAENGKVYTQEQMSRAASNSAANKEKAVKFTEAPAGAAQPAASTSVKSKSVTARTTAKKAPNVVNTTTRAAQPTPANKSAVGQNQQELERIKSPAGGTKNGSAK